MTHKTRLVEYFETHKGSITSLESVYDLGNTRLAATVFELRELGFNIESKQKQVATRYGKDVWVTEYIYHGKNESS